MSKFIKSAAVAAVLATSATGTYAAELSTDVDVSLPSIIALYCYDQVSVGVTAAGLTAALGAGSGENGLGNATISSFEGALDASSLVGNTAYTTDVNLNLNNVCAFRALVGADGVSVAVTQGATAADTTLVNAAGGTIAAAGATLTSDATVTTGLGLGAAATPISVRIPLDLSDATAPGTYSKSDLFTVTVLAI